jgi:endonuclease/exonuclease/phosphatase family metal-dependent hydrolase
MKKKLFTANILVIAIIFSNFAVGSVLADESDRKIKVMTYNMYPGTEFTGIFQSQSPQELVLEVGEAFTDVSFSNVPERIDAIAQQIANDQPDVVGLQEVALWRYGYPQDPASAEAVAYDFLEILLARLSARGVHYSPIIVQTNLDAELTGVFSPTSALDIRYTDRVVIIARTDLSVSELKIGSVSAGTFNTLLPVDLLGTTITVPRGWTSADIKHRGKTYRFINAHLESFYEPVQWAQAAELLQGPANTELPTILAGDFNSDAASGGFSYQLITGAGFSDVWSTINAAQPGFTWPLSEENPSSILLPNTRVDLVLIRGGLTAVASNLVGEENGDITVSGFRPSDHAGLAAKLVLRP